MKVLIIEDNPIDLKLARAVIQMSGHESFEQTSVAGALQSLRSYRPDIILLDLNLPDSDGIRFARDLRESAEMRAIPIVAVTAYPHQYRRGEALSAGCAHYVVKPLDTRKLVDQLQAVMSNTNRDGSP